MQRYVARASAHDRTCVCVGAHPRVFARTHVRVCASACVQWPGEGVGCGCVRACDCARLCVCARKGTPCPLPLLVYRGRISLAYSSARVRHAIPADSTARHQSTDREHNHPPGTEAQRNGAHPPGRLPPDTIRPSSVWRVPFDARSNTQRQVAHDGATPLLWYTAMGGAGAQCCARANLYGLCRGGDVRKPPPPTTPLPMGGLGTGGSGRVQRGMACTPPTYPPTTLPPNPGIENAARAVRPVRR